ncbi:MAG: C10 family peptidase [Bacteroidota bacterium]|nr:C10 family peptidase [Bacteroidota bacterium]
MKIKLLWIILLVGLFGANAFAKEVPKSVAEKVAKHFYYQHVNQTKSIDFKSIEINLKSIHQKNAQQTFYAFDVNENDGFVLVSAQNSVKPVIAYAFEGSFNSDNMHPGQAEMLEWYEKQIASAGEQRLTAPAEIENQWIDLINYKPENDIKSYRNVEPLLLVEWNQTSPYNAMCPEDAAAQGGHVPVGCVATAMLQVMKHWNYPETGTGSYTHSNYSNGGYGNITVNFANQTYNWEGMPISASGVNDELAKVNLHVGVAVRMYWGPTGSGASTSRIVNAFVDYFRYDHSCDLINKDYYGDVEYKNILKGQLDNNLPMVYSGSPESGNVGHAWNCDGYIEDEFHMNWGWGGAGNGYYTLDDLTSSATPGGDEYNFSYNQQAVINIYPEANYPEHCSGSKTIVAHQGAFGDGSADEDYNNNIDCEYLIAPECGNLIRVEFDRFDLGDGDILTLYDGSTSSGTPLATFDADNLPGSSTIDANTGNLLLHFQTDGSSIGKGWDVSFNTDYCGSSSSYTEQSGTVSDGSGTCDYQKSTVCFWYIEPDGAEAVSLDFTEFDLASGDYVNVYESSTSNLLETFDTDNIPETIVVNASKAIILFYANSDDDVAGGWAVNYSATELDIESIDLLHGVTLYPNPANQDVNLAFSLSQPETVYLKVYDMLGKTIAEKNLDAPVGYQKVKISQFVSFSESGLYFIDVEANGQTVTRKISIVK